MDTVSRLDAIEQIKQLKARYFRCVDLKKWDELRDCFTPDATLHFVAVSDSPQSLDQSVDLIAGVLTPGTTSIHHGHMPEIEVTGEHSAKGIWAMEDRLYFPDPANQKLGIRHLTGTGHYYETYERTAGIWRIRTLRLERLHVVTDPPNVGNF